MKNRLITGILLATLGVGTYFLKGGIEDYQISENIDKVLEIDGGNNFSKRSLSNMVEDDVETIGKDSVRNGAYFDIFEKYAGELSKIDPKKKSKQKFYQNVKLYNQMSKLADKIESRGLQETRLGIKVKRKKRDTAQGIVSYMKFFIDNCYAHFDIMNSGISCLGKGGSSQDESMERVSCLFEQKQAMKKYCWGRGITEISKSNPEFKQMYDTALVIALDNGMTL